MSNTTATTHGYTPEQMQEMRNWVAECDWAENFEEDEIEELTDEEIIAGVNKFYEGGIEAFDFDGVQF